MRITFNPAILTATALASALGLSACASSATAQVAATEAPTDKKSSLTVVEVKRGEVLQLIAPESRPDGEVARQAYYSTVLPRAQALGYRRFVQLNVKQKVVSDYDPGAFIFFAWPSEDAARQFEAAPDWPEVKATRADGWNELKIYSDVREQDLKLTFDPAKHYSVVVAWFDPEHPGDYERYLTGIEDAVARAGGRFIYKMRNPAFEAHASDPTAPGQITFVEWNTPDGFAEVQKSPEYLANRQYFGTGLERFEFYWLEPNVPQ